MPKYLISMPEGWIKSAHPVMCEKCPKSWACKNHFGSCPLASAVKAVEVKLVEDNEAGAGIIDKNGRFYHEEDRLYAVVKETNNGKV